MTQRRLVVPTSLIAPACFVAGFLLAEAPQPLPPPAKPAPATPAPVRSLDTVVPAELDAPSAVAKAPPPAASAPQPTPAALHAAPAALAPLPRPSGNPIVGALNAGGDVAARVELYMSLAKACKQKSFREEAKQFALAGLELNPSHTGLYSLLWQLDRTALPPFIEAKLAADPTNPALVTRVALSSNPGHAAQILQRALEKQPTDRTLLLALLGVNQVTGLRCLRAALELKPRDRMLIRVLVNRAPTEATPYLLSALADEPGNREMLTLFVRVMETLQTPALASPYLEAALANTRSVEDQHDLIRLLLRTDPRAAFAHHEALGLPESAETLSELAHARIRLGQTQAGLRLARRVYELESLEGEPSIVDELVGDEDTIALGLQLALQILPSAPNDSSLHRSTGPRSTRSLVRSATRSSQRWRTWIQQTTSRRVAYSLGEALEFEETPEVAAAAYARAFQLDPSDTEALDYLEPRAMLDAIRPHFQRQGPEAALRRHLRNGLLMLAESEPDQTVAYLDRFPRDSVHRDARFLDQLAFDSGSTGDNGGLTCARELLRRAERLDPGNTDRVMLRKELGIR